MTIPDFFKILAPIPTRRRPGRRSPPARRLSLETLEGRALPGFVAPLSFDTGREPESVAVGDFNGDAVSDLAVADRGSDSVSVLVGNGDGTFQPARPFAAGAGPQSVAVGEFNGDGRPDLAIANRDDGTVSVLLGNGDGTFQDARPFAAGANLQSVAVGEFNGDGRPDLAVANQDGSGYVSVLLGNGDGTFQAAQDFDAVNPFSVAVGDFNGDGFPDLAVASLNGYGNVSVLLGNGDGTFQAAQDFDVGDGPRSVAVGEFNGDGRPDLAVANVGSADVSVLLGNGDGTFQAARDFAVGQGAWSVAVGDFNGDSLQDLAVAQATDSGGVRVLLGNGDGTFQAAEGFPAGPGSSSVAVGEFNGDGQQDLAVANPTGDNVSVLLGHGDGTFQKTPSYPAENWSSSVAAGEFNGDGVPDLAVGVEGGEGSVNILLGNGDGTFQPTQTFPAGDNPVSVAVGDFNGDGRQDLVVANYFAARVSVLLGNGDGTFQAPRTFFDSILPSAVAVGEFNGDGIPDLAVGHDRDSGGVTVFLGNGDGTFEPAQASGESIPTGPWLSSVVVGEFNGDGRQDLAIPERDLGWVRVLLGQGDGTFQLAGTFAVGYDPVSVAVGDFNGDGRQDLAAAAGDGAYLLPGNGDGTFQTARNVGRGGRYVAPGDFNRDGVSDLITVSTGGTRVLSGNGDGSFRTSPITYMAGSFPVALAVEDLDGDGWADLAVVNLSSSDVSILRNEGSWTTVTINQTVGQADPTAGPTITFDVVFGGPVTGFDAADIDLSASTVSGTLVPAVTGSERVYTVSVAGMTGSGTVVARILAAAARDGSGGNTLASTSADNTVTFDGVPAVTIDQGAAQPDPTNGAAITFDVHFSEAVTGFDGSDVLFTGSTVGGTLMATVSGAGQDYTVTVTGMIGTGKVVASIGAGAAVNDLGIANAASTSSDNTVMFDGILASVTIDQAAGQSDPTNVASIKFDVKFSEPVTGFNPGDVSLAGSTAGGTLSVAVSGSLDTYTVTVIGMTTRGVVIASIPAGGATDAAGNTNLTSDSTDNSVEFLNTGTLGFSQAGYNTTENDTAHTATITVTRAGQTDGAVAIQYGTSPGTAHAGTDYTTTSGTLSWADGEGGDKTFTIPILPDALNEGKELINLALTNLSGSPGLARTAATVVIAPSDGQGPGVYFDQDGDKYTIKHNGKTGSMLYFRTDPDGDGNGPIELIELSGTLPDPLRPKASLVIGVTRSRTSTDGGTVGLGAITGTGLASIFARKATLNLEGINLAGYLGALTIGNIVNGADVTTLATTNPLRKTRINALAIGDGTAIDVGAHVSSLTATSFGAGSVKAPSLGTLLIRGGMAADVNITGVGVDPTKKALALLRVKGAVTGSDIFVTGNVGTVVVGSFRDSRLFAGYTGADDGTGAFNFPATVTAFRATGKTDGFQNSRVVATSFKTVTITNLDSTNPASPFGFYADTSLGAITVVGPTRFKYNAALPTPQGVDDFEVKIV